MRSIAAVTFVIFLVSGCLVGQRTSGPDADTDGLPDEIEVGGWNVTIDRTVAECFADPPTERDQEKRFVRSNELRQDTDGDGVLDSDEYFHGGDPTVNDTDGDGLSDGDEWNLRTAGGLITPSRLALNKADSDDDCLSDGQEIEGFDIPGIGRRTSDPTASDTDGDRFSDAWEFYRSHSDPRNPDTDNDGSVDGLDLDPLVDVWLSVEFTSLTVKQMAGEQGRVKMFWTAPMKSGSNFGSGTTFNVTRGQQALPPAAASPGSVDVDDQRGGSILTFDFYAQLVDEQDRPAATMDLNPYAPGNVVEVVYDVSDGRWAFRTADGSTEFGRQGSLETAQARITFDFGHSGPPSS